MKLKVGFADDGERVTGVRRILGGRVDLRADANGAWSVETALAQCGRLRAQGVSSIEQPVSAANHAGLARVRREGGLSVMADESLCTRADADALIAEGACDLFNVRLAKNGGFSGALAMLARARKAGLGAQLGVLVGETSILAAAEQEFLAGIGPLRHHETGFPRFLLQGDPGRGAGGVFWRGRLYPRPPAPGFGIRILPARLHRVTLRHEGG
ncbi:MAG: enolase C-terminal domain-like protein [Planctomycetota bacterium]